MVAGVGLRALVNIPFGFPIISESALFSRPKGVPVNRTQGEFDDFKAIAARPSHRHQMQSSRRTVLEWAKQGTRKVKGFFPLLRG